MPVVAATNSTSARVPVRLHPNGLPTIASPPSNVFNVPPANKMNGRFCDSYSDGRGIEFIAVHSLSSDCQFQISLERDDFLKHIALPFVAEVDVSQRFSAGAGDRLIFDCLAHVQTNNIARINNSFIHAYVVYPDDSAQHTLLWRTASFVNAADGERVASRPIRNQLQFSLPFKGQYELHFHASIDTLAAESGLCVMIDAAHVVDLQENAEALASVACKGQLCRGGRCRSWYSRK